MTFQDDTVIELYLDGVHSLTAPPPTADPAPQTLTHSAAGVLTVNMNNGLAVTVNASANITGITLTNHATRVALVDLLRISIHNTSGAAITVAPTNGNISNIARHDAGTVTINAGDTLFLFVGSHDWANSRYLYSWYHRVAAMPVPAAPPPTVAPPSSAPSLSAVADSSSQITVTRGSVSGADNYRLHVSSDGGTTWTLITNSMGTSFAHTGLPASTTRHYRCTPYNTGGDGPAATANATTQAAPAPPPTETVFFDDQANFNTINNGAVPAAYTYEDGNNSIVAGKLRQQRQDATVTLAAVGRPVSETGHIRFKGRVQTVGWAAWNFGPMIMQRNGLDDGYVCQADIGTDSNILWTLKKWVTGAATVVLGEWQSTEPWGDADMEFELVKNADAIQFFAWLTGTTKPTTPQISANDVSPLTTAGNCTMWANGDVGYAVDWSNLKAYKPS